VDELVKRAAVVEVGLTPVLDGLARAAGGELLGLEHRCKTADAIRRKLADELPDCPDTTFAEALGRLKDAVRYTVCLPDEGYADGAARILAGLADRGYERVRLRNSWAGDGGYPGVVGFWRSPDGLVFEVWLHAVVFRFGLAVLFLLSGLAKLPRRAEFTRAVRNYRLVPDRAGDVS